MNKERLNLLKSYLKAEISPLLIPDMPSFFFNNSVVLKANLERKELNGHYENTEFCPPNWYKEILEKSKTNYVVLVIDKLNEIAEEDQTKFIEILKYKKISTFELPKNCLIIVTCSDFSKNKINEEVYSLLAQI